MSCTTSLSRHDVQERVQFVADHRAHFLDSQLKATITDDQDGPTISSMSSLQFPLSKSRTKARPCCVADRPKISLCDVFHVIGQGGVGKAELRSARLDNHHVARLTEGSYSFPDP